MLTLLIQNYLNSIPCYRNKGKMSLTQEAVFTPKSWGKRISNFIFRKAILFSSLLFSSACVYSTKYFTHNSFRYYLYSCRFRSLLRRHFLVIFLLNLRCIYWLCIWNFPFHKSWVSIFSVAKHATLFLLNISVAYCLWNFYILLQIYQLSTLLWKCSHKNS